MNRKAFFDHIRKRLFASLSEWQVQRIEAVLDGLEQRKVTLRHAAYIMATAHHESDKWRTMEEYASGAAYEGRADLGNVRAGDGRKFKGRGLVQVTGRRNYTIWSQRLNVDMVASPEKAADLRYAVPILIDGMLLGSFTGKKLADYSTYYQMRRTVNGIDRATLIASYATEYEAALEAAGYGGKAPQPAPVPQEPEPAPSARTTAFSRLLAALRAIFVRPQ